MCSRFRKKYSRSALEAEEARSPLTRASLEAGVRVLKLATSTARSRDGSVQLLIYLILSLLDR